MSGADSRKIILLIWTPFTRASSNAKIRPCRAARSRSVTVRHADLAPPLPVCAENSNSDVSVMKSADRMALAVGILVDDSTVTIENTPRLRSEGMALAAATLHGSAGIAVLTMVSTLAISCVFTSVVFLEGPAKFLFTPLGLAVVFAMVASYALSRTLTPVMIGLLLKGEHHGGTDSPGHRFAQLHQQIEHGFELFRRGS